MTSARDGRRRRLLQDGSVNPVTPVSSAEDQSPSRARYAFRDDSVSLAIATGVAPRAWSLLAGLSLGAAITLAGLVAIDAYGLAVSAAGIPGGRLMMLDGVGSIAGWVTSVVWMVIAATALMLFGLRRQRMDDVSGAYRWWLIGACAALILSFNAATHAHRFLAGWFADTSGFSPLAANAFWWLALGGPVLGLLGLRLLADSRASRAGVAVGGVAWAILALGWITEAGLIDRALAGVLPGVPSAIFGPACVVAGPMLVLLALLLVSRQIVAEAEGKAAPPVKRAKPAESPRLAVTAPVEPEAKTPSEEPAPGESQRKKERHASRTAVQATEPVAKPTVWTDGADNYADQYEDDERPGRMSKAERKRLRKLKARDAA
ncbi:hypothetical protein [Botrimarina hoheduenensis]|uniref:Uncharacterized protein n=1 Tax=Botrimarina hoheduenensis TaxID=2528000 RepID=A0A5C5VXS9_9BACT|nr:hypothetical protein [Botrimarina hoheduenensis]TWT42521.1 hypothetical protein Pla111_28260 [Botrimarina hoheduenensis]